MAAELEKMVSDERIPASRDVASELQEIHQLRRFFERDLDELAPKIDSYKQPPRLYLEEYHELTEKVSELSAKEKLLTKVVVESTPDHQKGRESPLRSHVRAYLPHKQKSTVVVRPNVTVQEAFQKAMRMRGLTCETCLVYRLDHRMLIPWDTKLTELDGKEISVEYREEFQYATTIAHNFVRKTYFTLTFCDICRGLLLNGFRCQTCGYKFHQRCASNVPTLCTHSDPDNFYRQLLARNNPEQQLVRSRGQDADADAELEEVESPLDVDTVELRRHSNDSQDSDKLLMRERTHSAPNVTYVQITKHKIEHRLKHSVSLDTSAAQADDRHVDSGRRAATLSSTSASREVDKFNTLPSLSSESLLSSNHGRSSQHNIPPTTPPASLSGGPTPSPPVSSMRETDIFMPTNVVGRLRSSKSVDLGHGKEKHARPRSKTAPEQKSSKQRSRQPNDEWEIPDEIVIGSRVGSGSFGTVFKGQWHGAVAVKKLNVHEPTPSQLQAFKNEVSVLRKTRHVNIVLFMGWISRPYLAIVTQWCEGSSLYKHLHVFETKFEMLQLVEIGKQTAQGMDYLHAKKIIHRDLKSNNIFLQEDFTVKIGDFGLATVKTRWSGEHQYEQPTGSILWMAPEVIRMQDPTPYSTKSDVYAFGIVIYELVTQTLPYQHIKNRDQLIFMIGRGYLKPDLVNARKDTPKDLRRVFADCVKTKREERPEVRQILAQLESLVHSIPKIQRSTSEPSLNRAYVQSQDMLGSCSSPRSPLGSPTPNLPPSSFFQTSQYM
ncbi:serine/threonine-protein kinase A-Raf-like [Corticium candelabrum]|uniref:serine/threonine-protein kinase A-Raf-like n=1 Tax=Corticium candelabrum TaxID=121492 RepID=UPI002E253195|nr:serine/threonine-protein kinase A-Raf-like [Corticium candelabrum]